MKLSDINYEGRTFTSAEPAATEAGPPSGSTTKTAR